jgi:hypothetical protein
MAAAEPPGPGAGGPGPWQCHWPGAGAGILPPADIRRHSGLPVNQSFKLAAPPAAPGPAAAAVTGGPSPSDPASDIVGRRAHGHGRGRGHSDD